MDGLDSKETIKLLDEGKPWERAIQLAQEKSLSTAKAVLSELSVSKYPPRGSEYMRGMTQDLPEILIC